MRGSLLLGLTVLPTITLTAPVYPIGSDVRLSRFMPVSKAGQTEAKVQLEARTETEAEVEGEAEVKAVDGTEVEGMKSQVEDKTAYEHEHEHEQDDIDKQEHEDKDEYEDAESRSATETLSTKDLSGEWSTVVGDSYFRTISVSEDGEVVRPGGRSSIVILGGSRINIKRVDVPNAHDHLFEVRPGLDEMVGYCPQSGAKWRLIRSMASLRNEGDESKGALNVPQPRPQLQHSTLEPGAYSCTCRGPAPTGFFDSDGERESSRPSYHFELIVHADTSFTLSVPDIHQWSAAKYQGQILNNVAYFEDGGDVWGEVLTHGGISVRISGSRLRFGGRLGGEDCEQVRVLRRDRWPKDEV